MFTKAKIFNLALSALLLQRQVTDADTDVSNEANVLRTFYDVAFRSTLESLDLDSTSSDATLELTIANPTADWLYAYKYPTTCAFLRRIKSCEVIDNRTSHIPKRVGMFGTPSIKTIFTNEEDAVAEVIPYDVPLTSLSASAGMAIALRLASLAAPLITGKGAKALIDDLEKRYVMMKAEAQELDRKENFNFEADYISSEFVNERIS